MSDDPEVRIAELEDMVNDLCRFTPEMAESLANWIDRKTANNMAQESLRRHAERVRLAHAVLGKSE